MNSKSLGLLTVLLVVACNAIASASPVPAEKRPACTFETLKDGRQMIVCPAPPVVKVER